MPASVPEKLQPGLPSRLPVSSSSTSTLASNPVVQVAIAVPPRSRRLFGYSARSSPALSRFLGLGLPSASGRRRTDVAERRTTALDGDIAQRDYARWPSLVV